MSWSMYFYVYQVVTCDLEVRLVVIWIYHGKLSIVFAYNVIRVWITCNGFNVDQLMIVWIRSTCVNYLPWTPNIKHVCSEFDLNGNCSSVSSRQWFC